MDRGYYNTMEDLKRRIKLRIMYTKRLNLRFFLPITKSVKYRYVLQSSTNLLKYKKYPNENSKKKLKLILNYLKCILKLIYLY